METQLIGGSGFVGSRLSCKLFEQQHSFSIGDINVSQDFPENGKKVDVRKKVDLVSFLKGGPVVNLAAVHRDDVIDTSEYFSTNV